jgi:hypothetical protein
MFFMHLYTYLQFTDDMIVEENPVSQKTSELEDTVSFIYIVNMYYEITYL